MMVPVSDAGDISGGAGGVLHTDPRVHPPLLGTARHQRKCQRSVTVCHIKKLQHFIPCGKFGLTYLHTLW